MTTRGRVRFFPAHAAPALLLVVLVGGLPREDPPSLQERIDATEPGQTLVVPGGQYVGNVVIDKPLTLKGESFPHIRGDGTGNTVSILAPGVTIDGFTVSHSGLNLSRDHAAILVAGDDAVIVNNRIRDALHGVYVRDASGVRIQNNRVRGVEGVAAEEGGHPGGHAMTGGLMDIGQDRRGNGLHFWKSRGNVIVGNEISDTRDGIYFSFTHESRIEGNHVYRARYGLHYMYSNRNVLSGNRFERNVAGAALMFSREIEVLENDFTDNRGSRAYGVLLHNVDASVLRGNRIEGNQIGVFMQSSHRNETRENAVTRNFVGMQLSSSSTENLFEGNRIGPNLHDIDLAGRDNRNRWAEGGRGNHWSGATVLDLDGDGASEMPHREVDLLGRIRESFPLVSLLTEGPALRVLRFALQRAPVPDAHFITDPHPLADAPGGAPE